jgi:hypothetical protein
VVVRAGRPSQGARDVFLLGPARPVRPSNTGRAVPLPWAAKATLRLDLLPGLAGAAQSSSPSVLRAATAPRSRADARLESSAGQSRRTDTRRRWSVPPPGSRRVTMCGGHAWLAPVHQPRSRTGPVAPAARCLV